MSEKLRIAFGVMGNILTIFSSLAPIPTFYRIYQRKDTENFSMLPYATTVACNLFWAWYALPFITRDNLLLFIISAIQVVLQSVYLVMYFTYAPPDKRVRTTTMVAVILMLFALDIIVSLAFLRHSRRKTFAGVVATISSILAYAAPLSIMGLVIRTRSVEYMPFLLSLAIFCSGFTWTVYGILGPDVFVIVSDGLGFILSIMQLVLYARYYQPAAGRPGHHQYGSMKTLDLSDELELDSPPETSSRGEAGVSAKSSLNQHWQQQQQQQEDQVVTPAATPLLIVPRQAAEAFAQEHKPIPILLYEDSPSSLPN